TRLKTRNPRSLILDNDVPPIKTISAPVCDDVAWLETFVGLFVTETAAQAPAINADDRFGHIHNNSVPLVSLYAHRWRHIARTSDQRSAG
nr:hypothetical protein [Acidimicrobiales bacterium]